MIRTIAACVSSRAAFRTSTIWAWIVTSSAVVGSSAMSTLGSFAIAIAIIARWRMPPENSCGYWSTRCSGVRDAHDLEQLDGALARPRRLLMPALCAISASAIWTPTVSTGFSDVIGSWKIIAMSPPRISRSWRLRQLEQVLGP